MSEIVEALPSGWSRATLAEIAEVNPRSNASPVDDEFLVSFVPMAAVEAGTGVMDATIGRPWVEVRKGYTPFRDGDVLFAKITPCMENGKAAVASALINGIGVGSTEFFVMRPLGGIEAKFLLYFVLQEKFRRDARLKMRGNAGQLRVPKEFMESASIPIPPLLEQRRIVAQIETQFTRLDAAVAALERAQANLKRYRAAVLAAAVSGILQEAESSEIAQAGWKCVTIGEMAVDVRYGTSAKTNADALGVPVLRMGNIQNGRLAFSNLKYLPVQHPEFPELLLEPGDLLFNRTNSAELVGKSAVYRGLSGTHSYASYLIRVRLKDAYSPEFIAYFLNSIYGRRWVKFVVNQQVGQANVNGTKLKNLAIRVPPIEEQHAIVAEVERRLSVIEDVEASISANLQRGDRLRQTILGQAFAGQLVPQDPTDEPASVLLERIRAERVLKPTKRSKSASQTRKGQHALW